MSKPSGSGKSPVPSKDEEIIEAFQYRGAAGQLPTYLLWRGKFPSVHGGDIVDVLGRLAPLLFAQMKTFYDEELRRRKGTPKDLPAAVSLLWVSDRSGAEKGTLYMASAIEGQGADKETRKPKVANRESIGLDSYQPVLAQAVKEAVTSPDLKSSYDARAPHGHRRFFSCAETHIINYAIQEENKVSPVKSDRFNGALICTYGYRNPKAKPPVAEFMRPCGNIEGQKPNTVGCWHICRQLGIFYIHGADVKKLPPVPPPSALPSREPSMERGPRQPSMERGPRQPSMERGPRQPSMERGPRQPSMERGPRPAAGGSSSSNSSKPQAQAQNPGFSSTPAEK